MTLHLVTSGEDCPRKLAPKMPVAETPEGAEVETVPQYTPTSDRARWIYCWFVEYRVNEQFDGWFTAPPPGIGGWLTTDPNTAKRYTKIEAEAVAAALSYFNVPFRFSNWIATEHLFIEDNQR
jgi:hypothetical protein